MKQTDWLRRSLALVACGVVATLVACATGPEKKPTTVFYPSLPNPPRIQHLVNFSGSDDMDAGSNFKDFLVGEDKRVSHDLNKPYGVALHEGALYAVDLRGPGRTPDCNSPSEFPRLVWATT